MHINKFTNETQKTLGKFLFSNIFKGPLKTKKKLHVWTNKGTRSSTEAITT